MIFRQNLGGAGLTAASIRIAEKSLRFPIGHKKWLKNAISITLSQERAKQRQQRRQRTTKTGTAKKSNPLVGYSRKKVKFFILTYKRKKKQIDLP